MRARVIAAALLPVLALTACAPGPAPAIDVTVVPRGVQDPFDDQGSASARASVRAALVLALTTQADQLSRTRTGAPLETEAVRFRRLTTVESEALAKRDLAAQAYLTDVDEPFRSSRFTVQQWQGVAVEGDRAKAYVLGHSSYQHWDGTVRRGPTWQVKTLLQRSGHGWTLVAVRAASDDQG